MRAACPRQPLGAILFAVLGSGAARSPERFASGDAPPICPTTGVFRPHAKICLFRTQGSHRGYVLGRNIAGALDQPRLRRQGNQPATRTPDCRGPHFGRKPALRRILPGIIPTGPLGHTPAKAARHPQRPPSVWQAKRSTGGRSCLQDRSYNSGHRLWRQRFNPR